jgi:hypothetical protein
VSTATGEGATVEAITVGRVRVLANASYREINETGRTMATPAQEEKTAKKKAAALAKARKARAEAAHARKWDAIWPGTLKAIKRNHCTCDIRKGMTHKELKALGGGCTHRPLGSNEMPGDRVRYVCPVLDATRQVFA